MSNEDVLNNLNFRWSKSFDKNEIKELLVKNFGTFPIDEGALKPIKKRYFLAFFKGKLIAMSGIIKSPLYR